MADYEFDFAEGDAQGDIEPQITSVFMCTPGCITGVLQGCALRSITCNVNISK